MWSKNFIENRFILHMHHAQSFIVLFKNLFFGQLKPNYSKYYSVGESLIPTLTSFLIVTQ